MKKISLALLLVMAFALLTTGCSTLGRSKALEEENRSLRARVASLKQEKDQDLQKALAELTKSLQGELSDYKAKLEMTERGLVVTFLAEVFFDPGKDAIRQQGKQALDKVASVLEKEVPDSRVAVEGHTDSDPIRHSGWKSNWELSAARALAVLHYFIETGGISPDRLSAVAYGEQRPVASNDTREGKQKNRRVEIVILPSEIIKIPAA
ncbi:MAG: flagellar motor protein MotB [Candidatus Omnitrophota bacterium]